MTGSRLSRPTSAALLQGRWKGRCWAGAGASDLHPADPGRPTTAMAGSQSTTAGTMACEALTPGTVARRVRHIAPSSFPVAANATVPVGAFDAAYAGTEPFMGLHEPGKPPWEIGGPQPAVVALADAGLITGKVLDVGCGTGENALHLAARGLEVVGVDASGVGIEKAQAKARQRHLSCQFLVADALELDSWDERFDCIVDTGLLHLFSRTDCTRLVTGLHQVLRPGGRHHLVCFNHHKPPPAPRVSRHGIATTFRHGWRVERIVECRYEVLDGLKGPNAWQASLVRL